MQTNWKDYAIHNDKEILGFFGEYRFMSNFDNSSVRDSGGFLWKSPEHGYQAAKEQPLASYWVNDLGAKEVKKWGNSITLRPDWEQIKYEIMAQLVFDKYYRYKELRAQLLDTGEKFLEERNHWHDNYWGNCICEKCVDKIGKNQLGRLTMKIREFWN